MVLARRKCAKAPMHKLDSGQHEYGEQIFLPPESISACGECAAKVRKVLIRFIGGGESYETQSQRGYNLDIA